MKQTSVRLPDATYNRLRALAKGSGNTLASYIREAVEFYLEDTEDEFPPEWYAGEQQEAGNCTFSLDYLDEYLAALDKVYGPKDTPERDEQLCLHSSRILEQILPVDASAEADEEARRLSEELLNARLESIEEAMPTVIDWNPYHQPVETRSSACTSTEAAGEARQKPAERPSRKAGGES